MNTNRLIFQKIAGKFTSYLFLIFIFYAVPPAPLDYFILLSALAAASTLIFYSYTLRKNNVKAYFLYTVNSAIFFLLFGLRFWKVSIGISALLLISLTPSLLAAFIIPLKARSLSNTIYKMEQGFFTTMFIMGMTALPIIIVVFVLVPPIILLEKNNLLYVILGVLIYALALTWIHVSVHLFAKGVLSQWMRME
jgi:hypothetical protein